MSAYPLSTPKTATWRSPLAALRAYAALGARQEFAAKSALLARAAMLGVFMLVFSRLWTLVLDQGLLPGRTTADMLWYLATTELVVLSFPYLHVEMEADLRTGDLVARLPQPVPYAAARVAEAAGGTAVRLALLAPVGYGLAAFFGGGLPHAPGGLLFAAPLAALGALLALTCSAAIGLGAIWLHDASPLFWIWQKLLFMLGGLMLPLQLYPGWLRDFALRTPFAAMLNGPGRMIFEFDPADAASVFLQLLGWCAVALLGLVWLWSCAIRSLDTSGG